MAPKVIILKGLPGSGKSFHAKAEVKRTSGLVKRVNKDDLRAMLDVGLYSPANERFVLKIRDKIITAAIRDGRHIIVDDTNLNPIHERNIRKLVGPRIRVEIKDFTDVPLEVCLERNAKRLDSPTEVFVPEAVIHKMAKDWDHWKDEDCTVTFSEPGKHLFNPDLENCIIVDIDGTLAHVTARSVYDYTMVGTDAADEVVCDLVRRLSTDYKVILVSGREDTCRKDTLDWLAKFDIPYDDLLMRAGGDSRNDVIIKREIYDANIKDVYNVAMVLDDRDRCVQLWRHDLGLKTLQVGFGDF